MSQVLDPITLIAELFAYLGEEVTQAAHMLQTAALAQADGAASSLVAAALLHDVGHVSVGHSSASHSAAIGGHQLMAGIDNRHSDTGAAWLSQWFGPGVIEPVRLHVAAKRYLCAVEPAYAMTLSPASVYTLGVQGGPMSDEDAAAFAASPSAVDACRLRRWDDAAKDPQARPPPFESYKPLLESLLRAR